VSDETIEELQFFLPENLILAAFDLVDHEKGMYCNHTSNHFIMLAPASDPIYHTTG
jgi:hypothetical protein